MEAQDLRDFIERTGNALREELSAGFRLGDSHLRGHIDQQFQQVSVALEAADKQIELALTAAEALEVERVSNVEQRTREMIENVSKRIDDGDQRLREHIAAQYGQIHAALDSARRETGFAQQASEKAIQKAEAANEKRFESMNEFRGQLADQAAQFLPREVAETQWSQVNERLRRLEEGFTASSATVVSERRRSGEIARSVQVWIAGAGLLIAFVVLLANDKL